MTKFLIALYVGVVAILLLVTTLLAVAGQLIVLVTLAAVIVSAALVNLSLSYVSCPTFRRPIRCHLILGISSVALLIGEGCWFVIAKATMGFQLKAILCATILEAGTCMILAVAYLAKMAPILKCTPYKLVPEDPSYNCHGFVLFPGQKKWIDGDPAWTILMESGRFCLKYGPLSPYKFCRYLNDEARIATDDILAIKAKDRNTGEKVLLHTGRFKRERGLPLLIDHKFASMAVYREIAQMAYLRAIDGSFNSKDEKGGITFYIFQNVDGST